MLMRLLFRYNYRSGYQKHQKLQIYLAEGIQGFAWWWILWHLWTEPGHIFVSIVFAFSGKGSLIFSDF